MTLLATRGRADAIHVAAYLAPTLLVASVAARGWARRMDGPGLGLVCCLPQAGLVAWLVCALVVAVQPMRQAPADWFAFTRPEPRHLASPAFRYLREHGRPGDRIVAFPFGEMFYFYTWPPATRYSEMLPPEDGYHTEAEYHAFWDEMLAARPRFIVYAPLAPDAIMHKASFRYPLPGYHLAVALPWPRSRGNPAYIYEREDAP